MTKRLKGPASEREIYGSKKLIVLWDETVMEWGIYRKNDQEKVLQWIGDNEDLLTWCELITNLKLPEELQPLADQRKAERKAKYEEEKKRQAREQALKAREQALKAERREKYLESLSEEDEEDVLAREWNRERKREREEEEYQEWRKDGMRPTTTILDYIKEPKEPEEIEVEVEEVFPWERVSLKVS